MKRDQSSECGGCSSQERWLLHNIRHRGVYRHLCTSCVLKFQSGSFCPHCFEVYKGSLPPKERVMCLKCPSVSHLACVGLGNTPSYVCPTCLNPSLLFFDVGASNRKNRGGDGESVPAGAQRAIDQKSAKVLLAAARIASASMSKAADAARVEAERRVKEAALTKKRAREALERVSFLLVKEKEKGEELTAFRGSLLVMEQTKKSKGSNAVGAAVAAQKRIQNHHRAEGKDKSRAIPTPLTNIGSREKERWVGLHLPNTVQRAPKNGVSLDDKGNQKGSPASVLGRQQLQNPPAVSEDEKSSNSPQLHNHVVQGEKESNGVFSVPTVVEQLQHPRNNHDMEEGIGELIGFADSDIGLICPSQTKVDS